MINTLRNIWSIPDLKKRILYTLLMIGVFRVGAHVPIPFVDSEEVASFFSRSSGEGVFGMVDMFTGGAFRQMTVMALGIMPYISAQIILQLLQVVWPYLEKIKKEGEAGQRKIEQWTRYGTIMLAMFQAIGLGLFMLKEGFVAPALSDGLGKAAFILVTMASVTSGTALLMWIGERITHNGIGNGISLLIALGILASYPSSFVQGYYDFTQGGKAKIWVPIIAGLCILTTVAIILIQEGARKIPIQHARRQVGRKMTQSQTTYLPLKVNTAGVIPVIFSSAILTLPQLLLNWVGGGTAVGGTLGSLFSPYSTFNAYDIFNMNKGSIFLLLKVINLYTVLYVLLTVFFSYFYTAVTFNPADVADNLKKAGAFIPGYTPGKQTADYIDRVLTRITTVGAFFLVGVALIPQVLTTAFNISYQVADFAGGTGLIIVVGVILDTMKRVESQLLMRHYDGFRIRRQAAAAGSGSVGRSRRWSGRSK